MNTNMQGWMIPNKKGKTNEAWKSLRKQNPIQRRCPVMKPHVVPRQTRRGC